MSVKVLITGAAGFVASHLIRFLQEIGQDEIFAWVKDENRTANLTLDAKHICCVDITNKKQVEEAVESIRPEKVYHLSAQSSVGQSWKKPALTMEVNSVGTLYLLEALRQFVPQANVLLVGSAEQYGKVPQHELPIQETRQLEGTNPYSVSKMTQELTARMYVQHFQMHIVMVRAFNHIGPGQSTHFVIPDWCHQTIEIEQGRQEAILLVGNIQVKRDFMDVRDVVRAYVLLLDHGESGQVYNVGSGISYSLKEILEQILAESTVVDIRYEVDRAKLRPVDVEELRADISKMQRCIHFEPQYSMKQSIHDILEEMRTKEL